MASHTVKFQSVSIEVRPWRHPGGRDYFRAVYHTADGKRHAITRATLAKAKDAAFKKAVELATGTVDFSALAPHQIRAIRRLLDADPQLALVDEFLVWHAKRSPKKLLGVALDEFLAEKEKNRGPSHQNVRTLRTHLNALEPLRERIIAEITAAELPAIDGAARTRRNRRAAWVTFWKWCELREYLPHGEKTAPERLARPIIKRKVPATITPDQLRILFREVSPDFLPWLACVALSGIRTDEVSPAAGGEKSPLDWSDFKWDRKIIIVRPETDKNGQRRIVPISDVLRSWLWPVKKDAGRLTPIRAPWSSPKKGVPAETSRLGTFIGGWKANALRHSFISYRAAVAGLATAATEAGNSESEAKKSYNDAKSAEEGKEWFKVTREDVLKCSQNRGDPG